MTKNVTLLNVIHDVAKKLSLKELTIYDVNKNDKLGINICGACRWKHDSTELISMDGSTHCKEAIVKSYIVEPYGDGSYIIYVDLATDSTRKEK